MNTTALQHRPSAACFADQLRLVYDPAAGDYRNVPGVETRDPRPLFRLHRRLRLRRQWKQRALHEYARGGVGADRVHTTETARTSSALRTTSSTRPPSREFSLFRRSLTALVEHASGTSGGKPVVLVSHSQGGQFALEFLSRSPLA
uniref:Lecithin-cholesterol acyltransferase-like 1 n=1 Tax=Triticum urartu TaxID=4572 RepID=A0A8R7QJZ9_TRIUA